MECGTLQTYELNEILVTHFGGRFALIDLHKLCRVYLA